MKSRTLEDQVAALYQLMGYQVKSAVTEKGGIYDLTVTRTTPGVGSISLAIECKARTMKPVDKDEVLAFVTRIEPLIQAGTITVGVVITNATFTSEARTAARNRRLTLLTLAELTGEALRIRPYLDAIATTFDESIEAEDYINLTAHVRKWGRKNRSVQGKATALLKRWVTLEKQRFIFLIGDAGSGKSTSLLKFTRDLAKRYSPKKRIPVLLNARMLMESQSIQQAILKRIQPSSVPTVVLAEQVDRLNSRGELVLLIDGLDELPQSKTHDLFDLCLAFGSPSASKVALTCRSGRFESPIKRFDKTSHSTAIVELDPLTPDQIRLFLEKKGKGVFAAACQIPNLIDLAQRPHFLNLIPEMLSLQTNSEPISPAAVFNRYVNIILQRERQRDLDASGTVSEDLSVLSTLAMQMLSSGVSSLREDEAPRGRESDFLRLRRLPFLVSGPNREYRFSHKSFLEFFAALGISTQIREQNPSVLEHVLLSREVVEFVAGLEVPLRILEDWLVEPSKAILNHTMFLENVKALCLTLRKTQTGRLPRLRVCELRLFQIKCFQDAIFRFHDSDGVGLILGDNGMGKSTALHAIALCALGPDMASTLVTLPDRWLRNDAKVGYIQATFDVSGFEGQDDSQIVVGLEISRGNRQIKLVTEGEYASRNADMLLAARSKVGFSGLLVAGYGASRNFRSRDDSRFGSPRDLLIDSIESLFDGTKYPFEPRIIARLIVGDGTPFRELGAPPTLPPAIRDSVSRTLASLLPNPSEGGFTSSGAYTGWYGTAEIEELSDGYRSTLAWAGHLIVQLLATGNWTKGIDEIPGLVLIDELDLHLHPQWQRVAVENIRAAFPNLQFVASTHSPLVAAGACAETGCVLLVKREGDRAVVQNDVRSVQGWRADQVLASELFGYIIDRDPETERALREASILAGKGERRTEDEERRYQRVLRDLDSALIPSGQTEAERDVQVRRRRVLTSKARDLERELFGEES